MPEYVLEVRHKVTPEDRELLDETLDWWFGVLEMDPQLMIGKHTGTGGLLVLPFHTLNMDSEKLLKMLEEVIEYIKESAELT